MNVWIKKSIKLAKSSGYLDKLHEVYPISTPLPRKLPDDIKSRLKIAYDKQDEKLLLTELLNLNKFPLKDPYIGMLRKDRSFIDKNPKTVNRITDLLFSGGFNKMLNGIQQPIEPNRQMGSLFHNWLSTLNYPFVNSENFLSSKRIVLLKGSGNKLKEFANKELGCDLSKIPDIIARVGHHNVIGEAKFITMSGGHQSTQFEDALSLLRSIKGDAVRIAILDGIIWIVNREKMHRTISELEHVVLSSLLLNDYFAWLLKN